MQSQSAQDNDDATPRTPVERELTRNLLTGLRRLARRNIQVDHEWCKVRRAKRAGMSTMTVEFDSQQGEES